MNKKIEQKIIVKPTESDIRLDIFLTKKLDISRSKAQKTVKDGLVKVNESAVTSKYIVNSGDLVLVGVAEQKDHPQIEIIYEDKDILVIDKPAGITSHPAPGEKDRTVAEIFINKYEGEHNTDRDMVVHRLDKGTSGIMLLAKNEKSRDFLSKQFADRKVNKTYTALVCGRVVPKEGIIDMPLSRDIRSKNRMSPADEGKDAKTLYKVNKYYRDYTLVTANPKTGRTHQIRVHFAAIGHPLYGDERYGIKGDFTKRIFLHASELSILHPTTNKRIKFTSKLPVELKSILSKLEIE